MGEKYEVRDLRTRYAWQSQDALRILYENYDGLKSKNLVNLYVALTLKSTFCGFADEFNTTSRAICEYSHTSPDWIATGFKLLTEAGLINVQDRRSEKGYVLGKVITLTDAPRFEKTGTSKTGTSFLGMQKREDISKDSNIEEVSKDSIIEDVSNDTTQRAVKEHFVSADTWEYVEDIFKYATEMGMSTPTVTYTDGAVKVPQYVKSAITKIGMIADGTFADKHKIKDFPLTAENWREKIIEALTNLNTIREDARLWPYDKSKLPRNLDWFIYNPASGFSWLVKCLEPLETEREKHIDKVYGDIDDKYMTLFDKWFDYHFYQPDYNEQLTLKQNIGELIKTHKELWEEYGQYYVKQGKWRQYLGGANPDKFLQLFANYLQGKGWSANVSSTNPNNLAFKQFLSWVQKEYKIPLDLSEEKLKQLRGERESEVTTDFVIPQIGEGVIVVKEEE